MLNRKYRESTLLVLFICIISVLIWLFNYRKRSDFTILNQPIENYSLNLSYIFTPASLREGVNIKAEVTKLRIDPSEYKFAWDRWLNLSIADEIVESNIVTLQRHWEAAIEGAEYVKYRMPNPARIIILPKTAQFLVDNDVSQQNEVFNLQASNGERCHLQYAMDNCLNINPTYQIPKQYGYYDVFSPEISEDQFDWNIDMYLDNNHDNMFRAASIQAAIESASESQEHFKAPLNVSGHYDWRFFRGVENLADTALTLQSLMKAWSAFAASYNIEHWIAQGSALGYIWNGYSLPWDDDIDIQMPIQTLHRLAWLFNGTLLVQDTDQGSRTYFLDINPWYSHRESNKMVNSVDGRFIDTSTGSYIDISAVSKVNTDVGMSKTPQFHLIEDILPLRMARFEGYLTYVPRKINEYLFGNYPDMYNRTFENWEYSISRKAWIDTDTKCQYPIQEIQLHECDFDSEYLCPTFKSSHCRSNDASKIMRNYALMHDREVELWDSVSLSFYEVSALEPQLLTTFNDFFSVDLSDFRQDLLE